MPPVFQIPKTIKKTRVEKKAAPVKKPWKVDVIESERGWGSKVDETHEFETKELADKFMLETNAKNNLPYTPDIYWYATLPYYTGK